MRITIGPAATEDLDRLVELLGLLFSIERDFTPDPATQQRHPGLIDPARAWALECKP